MIFILQLNYAVFTHELCRLSCHNVKRLGTRTSYSRVSHFYQLDTRGMPHAVLSLRYFMENKEKGVYVKKHFE